MSNHIPMFPFRDNNDKQAGKPMCKDEKPRREIIQQLIMYSKALEIIKTKSLTAYCILN
jgi:hypothetical protein